MKKGDKSGNLTEEIPLKPSNAPNLEAAPVGARGMLLEGYQVTNQSSSLVRESLSLSANTEETQQGILGELDHQRSLINTVGTRVDEASSHMKKSDKLVSAMFRRAMTNKCVLMLIALILVATIAIIIVVRFTTRDSTPTTINSSSIMASKAAAHLIRHWNLLD
ncbi:hypothetical protein PAPYR_3298 [Paratrimastix pyriformis]|uniref:t-SNARE coiled-coil homology domain-containing protein n=1 Tax=Paratrimastix pyriformis TaxID=342808 RepID=A0ABQ8UV71_9EUKA|nr:hypothetical protein PAPYR_3298 [Paratrimastix pyriformis]|eukprot:GAFH01005435.1.p2 GENE.GAFH01005435.1~~GAFH01005435.1.p2  ORF type:complete len:164 (+),score=13.92 GAFH01005435.1:32-523(+)